MLVKALIVREANGGKDEECLHSVLSEGIETTLNSTANITSHKNLISRDSNTNELSSVSSNDVSSSINDDSCYNDVNNTSTRNITNVYETINQQLCNYKINSQERFIQQKNKLL